MSQPDFDALFGNDAEFKQLFAQLNEAEQQQFTQEAAALMREMENMFENFRHRTIHERLSTEILAKTEDKSLVLTVFDTLAHQAPKNISEADYLAALSPERRAVYALFILAGEVDNGGFNQYYYNTEAEAAAYLPEACELIGAPKYADLLRRANACYTQHRIAERQDGSLEGFCASYRNNPLSHYDDEFYLLEKGETLDTLLVRFIRRHPQAFVD
ncbi:DUF4375 domain-containing protein [Neisseria leonii]|uniref:DMP19 family protein n=1 Tax=Neisseria leonii TaxID=2995413 RepID=A0A9X4E5C5_9NEIS|nr:DUF4375 domain-containing protein [Neisseria sp. 51.81]MDD9327722.1 DMP19 family protein [Neisseria sp. 51.81]